MSTRAKAQTKLRLLKKVDGKPPTIETRRVELVAALRRRLGDQSPFLGQGRILRAPCYLKADVTFIVKIVLSSTFPAPSKKLERSFNDETKARQYIEAACAPRVGEYSDWIEIADLYNAQDELIDTFDATDHGDGWERGWRSTVVERLPSDLVGAQAELIADGRDAFGLS